MTPAVARRIAWSLVGVLLGLALVLALPSRPAAQRAPAAAVDSASSGAAIVERTPAAPELDAMAPSDAAQAAVGAATLALELNGDLHALARTLLPRAEAGDNEAQHGLALLLRACDRELKRHADRAALDAFLETVPRRSGVDPGNYAALQRDQFDACDGFRDDPLDRYAAEPDWLARAATAGHPLALLARELRAPGEAAARDPVMLREVALAALASQRPEGFMLLLELEFPEADGPEARDATPNALAWWLLACARGYPCGAEAHWRREQDAFRGSQRAALGWDDALLFDLPAHEREQARERAAELGRLLDAGEVEALLPLALREPLP